MLSSQCTYSLTYVADPPQLSFALAVPPYSSLCAELLPDDVLQGDGVGGEFADALAQLLDGHMFLVEVEAVERLVIDVRLLLDIESCGRGGVELLRDSVVRVNELLKEIRLCAPSISMKRTSRMTCLRV